MCTIVFLALKTATAKYPKYIEKKNKTKNNLFLFLLNSTLNRVRNHEIKKQMSPKPYTKIYIFIIYVKLLTLDVFLYMCKYCKSTVIISIVPIHAGSIKTISQMNF